MSSKIQKPHHTSLLHTQHPLRGRTDWTGRKICPASMLSFEPSTYRLFPSSIDKWIIIWYGNHKVRKYQKPLNASQQRDTNAGADRFHPCSKPPMSPLLPVYMSVHHCSSSTLEQLPKIVLYHAINHSVLTWTHTTKNAIIALKL